MFLKFYFQVNFFLATLSGHFTLPPKETMLQELQNEIKEKREKLIRDKDFHLVGMEQEKYYNDLSDTAGINRVAPVIHQIYYYVTKNRDLNDCFEILNENEYIKL